MSFGLHPGVWYVVKIPVPIATEVMKFEMESLGSKGRMGEKRRKMEKANGKIVQGFGWHAT